MAMNATYIILEIIMHKNKLKVWRSINLNVLYYTTACVKNNVKSLLCLWEIYEV